MKMTIAEAFRKYKEISIDYVFNNKCPQCGKLFDTVDDEYSFEGDLEYFNEWLEEYTVLDLDDEIEQIEGNRFKYEAYAPDGDLCPCCEKENGSSSIVYIPKKTRKREQGTKRILSALKYTDDIDAPAKEVFGLIEDVLDTLIEVGNGTTDEMLHEAADKLFRVRDLLKANYRLHIKEVQHVNK